MANPLYGQNKSDSEVDAAANITSTAVAAAGDGAGSCGVTTECNADKVAEIVIGGVTYFIPLFTQNA